MLIGDVWISPPMVAELSELTGVHVTTVRRWLKTRRIPEATYQLLDLLQNGSVGRIHAAWSDWRINARTGELLTPVGTKMTAGEILATPYRLHLVAALQIEVRELKCELQSQQDDADRRGDADADKETDQEAAMRSRVVAID